jgi:long-subunit fatty acid transport protein
VDTPESISVNGFHKLNDKVDLMADLTWTRHSGSTRLISSSVRLVKAIW